MTQHQMDVVFDQLEHPELLQLIEDIGVARFVGRINAGVVSSELGYAALEYFVSQAKERPLASKVAHAMLGRSDTYSHR
jgi:uncharacterized protein (DUF2062 family)